MTISKAPIGKLAKNFPISSFVALFFNLAREPKREDCMVCIYKPRQISEFAGKRIFKTYIEN